MLYFIWSDRLRILSQLKRYEEFKGELCHEFVKGNADHESVLRALFDQVFDAQTK